MSNPQNSSDESVIMEQIEQEFQKDKLKSLNAIMT